jgi:hypothetical protein
MHKSLVGFHILGSTVGDKYLSIRRQLDPYSSHNLPRDLILQIKDTPKLPIKILTPENLIIRYSDKLYLITQAFTCLLHAADKDCIDTERTPGFRWVCRFFSIL